MHASASDLNRESLSNSNNPDEIELKRTLYESMKNSGVLGSLKSQLRSKLYDQLKIKQEAGKTGAQPSAGAVQDLTS